MTNAPCSPRWGCLLEGVQGMALQLFLREELQCAGAAPSLGCVIS